MRLISERPSQTPCEWCGHAVDQAPTGRLRRYCEGRACRQRAYEARTAERRLGADVQAGRVRPAPSERVVERVLQPRHPHNTSAWEVTLAELAAQLSDGRIPGYYRDRIRRALHPVNAALGAAVPAQHRPQPPQPVAPLVAPAAHLAVDPDAVNALVDVLGVARGPVTTTLQRLAADGGADILAVRRALIALVDDGVLRVRRHGVDVEVQPLADHARFDVAFAADDPGPRGGAS